MCLQHSCYDVLFAKVIIYESLVHDALLIKYLLQGIQRIEKQMGKIWYASSQYHTSYWINTCRHQQRLCRLCFT